MNRWNPTAKARNFVARMRQMSDDVGMLRREVDELRALVERTQDTALREIRTTSVAAERSRIASSRAAIRTTLRGSVTRVVFLVHNIEAWDAIGEVVSVMRASADFDPIVVSIPHHYGGGSAARGEGRVHRFLRDRKIPHLRLRNAYVSSGGDLLQALDPDLVFRQSQWDADVDGAFSPASLSWTRLAIIPYETMNPTLNVPWGEPPVNSALDQHLHRAAWLVFCANDEAMAIARTDTITGARQYRAVGHPKADAVRATVPEWPFDADDEAPRRRVLWSAHHSILEGWNDFGMFPRVKDDMLAWARETPGTEFVFMHHPHLRGTIRRADSVITDEEFRAWLDEWKALPNTAYWRGGYAPVMAATEVLITDGPSMITEAQLLTVPTVFLERAEHIPFNRIGERVVTGVHRVPDAAAAREAAEALLASGTDPLAETQAHNVEVLFGEPGAAVRIVDVIRAEITAERDRS